jgi:GAF domain-containing protein
MTVDRERPVTEAFVSLAKSLVDGVDTVDLLTELTSDCARLLDIASAGLLLADTTGVLHVMAASSERTRDLEVFQVQRDQGPCLDCFHTGVPVSVDDLADQAQRWPQFVATATELGFVSVHAVPMRLRTNILGALNLFGTRAGPLSEEDLRLAQALADVASIAIVADHAAADSATVNRQLQTALTSRVVLEQAKGLLAQLGDLDMDQSFAALRRYARDHNQGLSDLARALVARAVTAQPILDHATAKGVLGPQPRSRHE